MLKNISIGVSASLLLFTHSVIAEDYLEGSLVVKGSDLRIGVDDGRPQGRNKSYENRAFVHGWERDELFLNFDNDFEEGVKNIGNFYVQVGTWLNAKGIRISPEDGDNDRPTIGSTTGQIDFWHFNHGYTDIYARNITAEEGGKMYAADFVVESDQSIKENIRPINYGLSTVLKLRGVEYNLKRDPEKLDKIGLIAQEVEKVLPQVVYPTPDDIKGVNYQAIVPVLIEAIKEQQKTIEQQQSRLEQLEAKLAH